MVQSPTSRHGQDHDLYGYRFHKCTLVYTRCLFFISNLRHIYLRVWKYVNLDGFFIMIISLGQLTKPYWKAKLENSVEPGMNIRCLLFKVRCLDTK